MKLKEGNGIQYCIFPEFESLGIVTHAFTTRHGGVSEGVYATLNIGYHVGDEPAAVATNRARTLEEFGFDCSKQPHTGASPLVAAEQVHGDLIVTVTEADRGAEWAPHAPAVARADGLITKTRGLLLSAYFADCVPVYLIDPVKTAVGLVHAGWRGTSLRITEKGVLAMRDAFGTDPQDILAAIGPSIGPCCYKVGEDVVGKMDGGCIATPERREDGEAGGKKYSLDLWETNRRQLLRCGVLPENIFVAGICTCCHQEDFFSYRGSGGRTGRMGALIGLL